MLMVQEKDIMEVYNTPIVQQTVFWSKLKQKQGINSIAFDFDARNSDLYVNVGGYSYTKADALGLIQYLNTTDYVIYFPYGPEVEPSEERQGLFLEEFSECIRSYLPKGCITIRYDLNWQSHWCKTTDFDDQGNWMGNPATQFQEFQMNYNTQLWNLRKANSNILPANTIMVDLEADENEILNRMKPKTRYNIRLAYRKRVHIKTTGLSDLNIWYQLYTETALRNGLYVNDLYYFKSALTVKMEDNMNAVDIRLLIAYVDEEPLAAMFLVISNERATYLYGASSSEKRNFMPTYALQWEAIKQAKAMGCREYDMFGIAPNSNPAHPMYGLYKFKQGFGGNIFHQMGCWDYPLDADKYALLQASEMCSQGYYN